MKFFAAGRGGSRGGNRGGKLRPFLVFEPPFSETVQPQGRYGTRYGTPCGTDLGAFLSYFRFPSAIKEKSAPVRKPHYLHIQTHVSKAAAPQNIKKS